MPLLRSRAPAKINLTLRIVRQRTDGYHEIVSLVAFADVGDELTLAPGNALDLDLSGSNAAALSDASDNLVLVAAHTLDQHIKNLKLGRFELKKNLPVGAGLGGGSADAAAALRLLATANDLEPGDARIYAIASMIGADVSVCLESKARVVTGIGDQLSAPIKLPPLPAVIVFPGAHVATAEAFGTYDQLGLEILCDRFEDHPEATAIPLERHELIAFLNSQTNDLTRATELIAPVISTVKECLHKTIGTQLVRMSGSGSSVFAIYENKMLAEKAAKEIRGRHSDWWVRTTNFV
jgi:4-diphosphocytidyl-2-C-methyl-D-erythritol kinase